jgi:radical SAM-linked protein
MIRQRVRIRFCKAGHLRLIGHRDLVRAWERMLRRCDVSLSMSEGFHPKPRMSFPSALALGVEGRNEVLEIELAEPLSAAELKQRLVREAPAGLSINDVTLVPEGTGKPQARVLCYELPVPGSRQAELQHSIATLLASRSHPVQREGPHQPVDVRSGIAQLELQHGRLRLRLTVNPQGTVRPGEVLAALGAADLAADGFQLQRTDVEVAP